MESDNLKEIEGIMNFCRNLVSGDNERDMDHWIVERDTSKSDGFYSSAIKNGPVHFVTGQNGSIESWISPRRRVGLWNFDTQHMSGLDIKVNGRSEKLTFLKYVRGFSYIYRQYEEFERLDFISTKKAILELELRSEKKVRFEVNIQILHETAWPQSSVGKDYRIFENDKYIEISSSISSTRIYYSSDGKIEVSVHDSNITIGSDFSSCMGVYVSCDGSPPEKGDIEDSIRYNEKTNSISNLVTPSFRINKLFRWSKHDLLELFTPTPIGSGFYAGIPQFSWFFGRDGEWMSMAAMECGMGSLAQDHLDMLYSFSRNGRIPHEIPLSNEGHIDGKNYKIGSAAVSTQFMSIDSSPLWVICQNMLSGWTGIKPDLEAIRKVMNFCHSCDRDGDGFLENRFSEGLIGWPESWAQERDGICVDVNAWWLEAMRISGEKNVEAEKHFENLLDHYTKTFYRSTEKGIEILDSINGDKERNIKGAMQIVPAMYFNGPEFKRGLKWLYQPDLVTEWGVRSVSNRDRFYDGGYHTGTVWPLMTGWMALALYNNSMYTQGFDMIETFTRLAFAGLEPGRINETYNPEFLYAEGQFFQGWSSSLFIQSIMEGMLGFERIPTEDDPSEIMNPHIPEDWDEVKLLNFPFRKSVFNITVRKGNRKEVSDISKYIEKNEWAINLSRENVV